MKHSLNPYSNDDQYVFYSPAKGKRRDFSSKELSNLRVHRDDKPLINRIKKKK